jgi:hypothetical protein
LRCGVRLDNWWLAADIGAEIKLDDKRFGGEDSKISSSF